jgi:hypothetical protein
MRHIEPDLVGGRASPNHATIDLIGYFKAGRHPHSEVATDHPKCRRRIMYIYIEFKGTELTDLVNGGWPK